MSINSLVLGNPIFIDYYTVHDQERNRMGFAPHTLSSKRNIEVASNPEYMLSSSFADTLKSTTYLSMLLATVLYLAF